MKQIILSGLAVVVLFNCKPKEATKQDPEVKEVFKISSTSFGNGDTIPDKYSCNVSKQVFPQLTWSGADAGVLSYALIMDDPDAIPVAGYVWNHWLLYDIPMGTTGFAEGADKVSPLPAGIICGTTSFGDTAYGGPCPPSGQVHHYYIKLYGIDKQSLGLPRGANASEVRGAMKGHVLDSVVYLGLFKQ